MNSSGCKIVLIAFACVCIGLVIYLQREILNSATVLRFYSYPSYDKSKFIYLDYEPAAPPSVPDENPASDAAAWRRFDARRHHLEKACRVGVSKGAWSRADVERHHSTWVQNDNLLVEPEREVMMCVSPKCGSTSWHKLIRELREPLADPDRYFGWQDRQKNNQLAQELAADRGKCLLKRADAFRAVVVKHPFARLVSGWNQKTRRGAEYARFLLEGYPLLRAFASERDPDHVITFADMMRYLARYGHDPANLDYHFLPTEHLCKPCLYPYNVVIKMESLSRDEAWLKRRLNVSGIPWEVKGPGYRVETDPAGIVREYFRDVDRATVVQLMAMYHYDFVLFGYSFDVESLTAGGLYT